jgi:hypothetical protein
MTQKNENKNVYKFSDFRGWLGKLNSQELLVLACFVNTEMFTRMKERVTDDGETNES